MECPNCGAQVVGSVCEYCGSILKSADPQVVIVNNYYGPDAKPGQADASQWSTPQTAYSPQASGAAPASSAPAVDPNVSPKSRTITVLLAVFFGYLGVHRFYSGRIGLGVLYLLTCGLFCFGWGIDIVMSLLGILRDGQGRYISRW